MLWQDGRKFVATTHGREHSSKERVLLSEGSDVELEMGVFFSRFVEAAGKNSGTVFQLAQDFLTLIVRDVWRGEGSQERV